MARDLNPVKSAALREYATKLAHECCVSPTPFPYFVPDNRAPLSADTAKPIAQQLLKATPSLANAFLNIENCAARKKRALSKFRKYAVPAQLLPDARLLIVTSEPHESYDRVRIPLAALHLFIFTLRRDQFTNKQISQTIQHFLETSTLARINYLDPEPHLSLEHHNENETMAAPLLTLTPTLPTFKGSPDDDVNLFLSRLDRLLAIYPDLSWEQKLFYLENQCIGGPLLLVQRELQWLSDHPTVPARTTRAVYQHIRTALSASYNAERDIEQFRDALQTRVKKETESLQEYVQNITELCRKAKIRSLPEKLRHMHKGLPVQLNALLRATDYTDVPTFLAAVTKLEQAQRDMIRTHTQHALETGKYPPNFNPLLPTPRAAPAPAASAACEAASPAALTQANSPPTEPKTDASQIGELISLMTNFFRDQKPTISMVQPDTYHDNRPRSPGPQPYEPRPPQGREGYSREGYSREGYSRDNYRGNNFNRGYRPEYRPNSSYYRSQGYNNPRPAAYRSNYDANRTHRYDSQRGNPRPFPRDDYRRDSRPAPPRSRSLDNRPPRRPVATNPSYRTPGPPQDYTTNTFQNRPRNTSRPNQEQAMCNICNGNHHEEHCKLQSTFHSKN